MKNSTAAYIAVISVIISLILLFKVFSQSEKISELEKKFNEKDIKKETVQVKENNEVDEKKEIEIVHFMERIQSFHSKLYFAGINNNKLLLEFYIHEIKEEMDVIAGAGIFDEGVNISENMKVWGIRNVNKFSEEMATPQFNFKNSFKELTNACNSCHQSTGHPFIKIIEPTAPSFFNQDFK
jgi:hypothetical protein